MRNIDERASKRGTKAGRNSLRIALGFREVATVDADLGASVRRPR